MEFINSSALLKPGYIKTSSKIYMFWMTKFRGYQIMQVIQHPKKYSLGRLVYERTWVLRPLESQ
jgi:hypothetical protein